jgi:dTDP-glucose 4,6-dehydratase
LKDLTGGATDAAGRISFVTDRPGHDFRYALDTARLAGEIGWAPATAHDEALRRTVAWYLENRDWWEKLAAKTYDGGRLGQIST